MNATDFKKILDESTGAQFIITGLIGLIEDEGMTAREAFEFLDHVKQNTFHALKDIEMGQG